MEHGTVHCSCEPVAAVFAAKTAETIGLRAKGLRLSLLLASSL